MISVVRVLVFGVSACAWHVPARAPDARSIQALHTRFHMILVGVSHFSVTRRYSKYGAILATGDYRGYGAEPR